MTSGPGIFLDSFVMDKNDLNLDKKRLWEKVPQCRYFVQKTEKWISWLKNFVWWHLVGRYTERILENKVDLRHRQAVEKFICWKNCLITCKPEPYRCRCHKQILAKLRYLVGTCHVTFNIQLKCFITSEHSYAILKFAYLRQKTFYWNFTSLC